jgi:competence protein ComEC
LKNSIRPVRDIKVFHTSWLIAWASFGLLVGTYFSQYTIRFIGFEWVVVSVCLLSISFINKKYLAVLAALLAGISIGLYRGGNQIAAQSAYEQFQGLEVTVSGRVAEDPSYDADGDLRMRLRDVEVDGQPISGELWTATSNRVSVKRSDVIIVEGRLTKGFGNIPAAIFRARVTSIERQDYADVARDTRDRFADGIREGVREPEASLGSGFLLGQKTALPEKLDNELRLLGLTHIVVASGYNLSILVRFGRRWFSKISRFTGLAMSSLMIFGFANVTGFSPSMSRAALITGLSLLAWYYGRKFHPLVLLSFSAAITVLINPAYAWGDIGWLLSFTSFIGVIMLSPLIHTYFWGEAKPGNVRQVFIETLSAQVLTLPLIAYVFGQYSPLALVANVLILPLIPIAMLLTFIAGIGGLLLPFAAQQIGWPAETLMGYMTAVVDRLAQQPLADSAIEFSVTAVIVGYLLVFSTIIFLWRRTGYKFRDYNVIE